MPKRIHPNRAIERTAVNAPRVFFESHSIPFFEVELRVDFGKDAVIELVDGDEPTGQWVGLQIRGGKQTYRYRNGSEVRGLPFSKDDARHLRNSNIPVLGVVPFAEHNFTDLLWINLADYCRSKYAKLGKDRGGFAEPMEVLNSYNLSSFLDRMGALATNHLEDVAFNLVDPDSERQQASVVDCFVLGRSDPRALVLVRQLLTKLSKPAAETAINALVLAVGHGDIFYHPRNTLPDAVRRYVKPYLKWSNQELEFLLGFIPEENEEQMWGRGTFGQGIDALIAADPMHFVKLLLVAESRKLYPELVRRRAYILAVSAAGEAAPDVSSRILRYSHDLVADPQVVEIAQQVREHGWLSIY